MNTLLQRAAKLEQHDCGVLGASHQTGWTGAVARLMHLFATIAPKLVLATGKRACAEMQTRPGREALVAAK
jgi:hypothetical protein